jgi:hypothetical protein
MAMNGMSQVFYADSDCSGRLIPKTTKTRNFDSLYRFWADCRQIGIEIRVLGSCHSANPLTGPRPNAGPGQFIPLKLQKHLQLCSYWHRHFHSGQPQRQFPTHRPVKRWQNVPPPARSGQSNVRCWGFEHSAIRNMLTSGQCTY